MSPHEKNQLNRILHNQKSALERPQAEYLRSMMFRNCSRRSLEYWAMNLSRFNCWCREGVLTEIEEITSAILKNYRQHVFHYRNPRTNKPLKFSTQNYYLFVVKRYFAWLHENGITPDDVGHRNAQA